MGLKPVKVGSVLKVSGTEFQVLHAKYLKECNPLLERIRGGREKLGTKLQIRLTN